MKLPWQAKDTTHPQADSAPADDATSADDAHDNTPKGYTPKKGRPTPKRNEVERARGYRHDEVKPAQTPKELRAQRKALKASMTREEWKQYKAAKKEERTRSQRAARAGMDRGDERYLLARDKGPVKAFVRNWVDSRRFATSLMMPFAVVLLVFMIIGNEFPRLAAYVSMFGLIGMLIIIIEGIWLGRSAAKAAKMKYPDATDSMMQLGFYAFSRANQPRKLRTPKPRVAPSKASKNA